jgi:dihydrofolate reductase
MKKLTVLLHISLDGFTAGPNGEMNWIKVDQAMFDMVGTLTDEADTALYGRITWQMMEAYWPTAAEEPGASKHDIEHAEWYNRVNKVVVSHSMEDAGAGKTTFIGHTIPAEIEKLKNGDGKGILLIGSPSVVRLLMEHNLIDDYWLFVNPILLGSGIPAFAETKNKTALQLLLNKQFSNGVTAFHYSVTK